MKKTIFYYFFASSLVLNACQKKAPENANIAADSTQISTAATPTTVANDVKSFFEQYIKKTYPTATSSTADEINLAFEASNGTEKTKGNVCHWKSAKGDIYTTFTYTINNGKAFLSKDNLKAFDAQGNDISTSALDWATIDAEFQKQLKEAPARGFMVEKDFFADFPMANYDRKTLSIQLINGKDLVENDGGGSRVVTVEFEWNSTDGKFVRAAELPESPL